MVAVPPVRKATVPRAWWIKEWQISKKINRSLVSHYQAIFLSNHPIIQIGYYKFTTLIPSVVRDPA